MKLDEQPAAATPEMRACTYCLPTGVLCLSTTTRCYYGEPLCDKHFWVVVETAGQQTDHKNNSCDGLQVADR